MGKITDKQLRECIVNMNHNSDNMFEAIKTVHEGFIKLTGQNTLLLVELKDMKTELINLKKENKDWFKLSNRMLTIFVLVIIGVFALVGIKLGGVV